MLHRKRTEQKLKCSIVVLRVKRVIVKLTKRLVALLLALMLVVGLLAVTASAAYSGYCSRCGGSATIYEMSDITRTTRVDYCGSHSGVHEHINVYSRKQVSCSKCGTYNQEQYKTSRCPYA